MKITILSGAGISKDSGIETFRDKEDGLWENNRIEDIATPKGWKMDKVKVLNFYNNMRRKLMNVEPNESHKLINDISKLHEVSIITQNVDDLHERAGNTDVIHLHGELTKARGTFYEHKKSTLDPVYNIGYDDINIGDFCEMTGSQLRPHIVWFNEMPNNVSESYKILNDSDIVLIIGTSLNITYINEMLSSVMSNGNTTIYYIDPSPSKYLDGFGEVNYIEKTSTKGIKYFMSEILQIDMLV